MSTVSLSVTAITPHGVVLSRPWGIPLDALLASVVWHRRKRDAVEAGGYLKYRPEEPQEILELPLARCGDPNADDDWHWMSTFADLHPQTGHTLEPDIRWRTSRTNRARLQQLAPTISGRVSDRAGRYQRRVVPVMAHPATHLTWRAVGDPECIREMLTELPSIGPNRGVGEGVVSRWEVTEEPSLDQWEAGHEHAPGVLGRTTPLRCIGETPSCEVGVFDVASIRPPYLHRDSRTRAFHPAR